VVPGTQWMSRLQEGGTAEFNWKFDAKGKFLGTTFMGMTPPRVQ